MSQSQTGDAAHAGTAALHPVELLGEFRRALRGLGRVDTSAFAPLAGLRVGLGVVIALVIGSASGDLAAEAAMAAGALLAGIPGAVSPSRASLRTLGAITFAMALSAFVGSASGGIGWLHTAVLVPWCLAGGLLLGLSPSAASVGTQAIAAMIVFGRFAEPPAAALRLGGFVAAGGVIATLVFALTRTPLTSKAQSNGVAGALESLAELARAGVGNRRGVASAEQFDAVEGILSRALVAQDAFHLRLRSLLDVARRARLELLAIEGLLRRMLRLGGAETAELQLTDETLEGAALVLEEGAATLRNGKGDPSAIERFDSLQRRTRQILEDAPRTGEPEEPSQREAKQALAAHIGALAGQLRAVWDLAQRIASGGRPPHLRPDLRLPPHPTARRTREGWHALRDHFSLSSPIGRHAVRLTVVVVGAEILALHSPLQRGYWVALTASVVLRPDFSVTFSRGLARMIGTAVGVVLASLLEVALGHNGAAEIVATASCCALACACFAASYALFSCFLTGTVVLLIGLVSSGGYATALDRLEDTLIGGALALAAYALWPTWSLRGAPQAFSVLAERLSRYLNAILSALSGGGTGDGAELRRLARDARRAKAEADDALGRSVNEPEGRRFSLVNGQGIIAALSRISLAAHALRADLEDGRVPGALPELGAFAERVDEALETITARLGELAPTAPRTAEAVGNILGSRLGGRGAPRRTLPPLRPAQEQLAAALADQPGQASLLTETDELVDALNTLGSLVGLNVGSSSIAAGSD